MWGVRTTFPRFRNGLSEGSGSSSKTSIPAPAIRWFRSAAIAVNEKINLACSGAVSKNIFRASNGGTGQNGEAPQADQLASVAAAKNVKVVVLSTYDEYEQQALAAGRRQERDAIGHAGCGDGVRNGDGGQAQRVGVIGVIAVVEVGRQRVARDVVDAERLLSDRSLQHRGGRRLG